MPNGAIVDRLSLSTQRWVGAWPFSRTHRQYSCFCIVTDIFRHQATSDVFDGEWYRILRSTLVTIDGIPYSHHYFDHQYDIALGVTADSYLLFKRRRGGPSATPILIQNFNLPPQIRTRLEHLLCLGVIPGPHQPKDFASFLAPLDVKLALLASGVDTFDTVSQQNFLLRAYTLFKNGDILAIEKMLNIKGHNGVHPCRSCNIEGVRNIIGKGTVYYVPLRTPTLVHQSHPSVDPNALNLRTHREFVETAARLSDPTLNKKQHADLSKATGIRGLPCLRRVASVDYARCIPWEWMHLFLENIIPTLVDHWTGRFKGLDSGREDYEIPADVWLQIGEETACAVSTLPSAFVRVLGNIAQDRSLFTAEAWGFWFMYLAPIVLKDRFSSDKFYKHVLLLVHVMRKMIKFTLTMAEVDEIEEGLVQWVTLYER